MKSLCLKLGLLSLALFACFGLSHTAKAFTDSDILYNYSFDNPINIGAEKASSSKDLIKSERNGYTISSVTGKFGNAYSTTGSGGTDGACLRNASASWADQTNGNFTLSFWYKSNTTQSYGLIFNNRESANYKLDFRSSATSYFTYFGTDGNWHDANLSSTGIWSNDNSWHNIIIMGEYGHLGTNSKLYKDGTLIASNWGSDMNVYVSTHNSVLTIGGEANTGASINCNYTFEGALDDFTYFTKQLDTTEITALQTQSIADYLTPSTPDTQTPLIFSDNYSLYTNSTGLVRYSYDETTFTSPNDYLTVYKCGSLPLGTLGAVTCSGATNLGTSSIWTNIDIAFGSPSGNGILSMTSTSSERTLYYVVATKTGSTNLYYPVSFYVSWNNGIALNPDNFIGTTSTSSLMLLLGGVNTYSAACSYEEWTATSSFAGINLTLARCSATKAALDLANLVARIPMNVANGFISVLQNLFPFNIPIKIKQSFDTSTSTLPVTLNYYNIADNNGNLAIMLPKEWMGSSTDMSVPVWGPGIMTENQSAADFFAGIKAFSTYIMWFMFIIYIWHKAQDIKEEATLERMPPTEEKFPKENYRY